MYNWPEDHVLNAKWLNRWSKISFFGQSFSWISSRVKQPFKLLSKMLSHYMFCRVTRWRLAGRVEFVEFFCDFIFWEPVNILQFGLYWEPVSGSRGVLSILPFSQPFLLGWTSALIFLETKYKSRNSMVTFIESWFLFISSLLIFAHSVGEVKSCWGDFLAVRKAFAILATFLSSNFVIWG